MLNASDTECLMLQTHKKVLNVLNASDTPQSA